MTHPIISVEALSKAYRLGQIGTGTISRDLEVWWARARGKPNPLLKIGQEDHGNRAGETIWALKDVSFEVAQGEVLGVIGRNGAGKSTLLKILSRVTAPTSGRVKVKGRIASLLEVGTGFHPELTGRENISLNGAILGMTRQEIARKFDEIVSFAEIEKFIDTPVKRYSSGMYVRLAFAVAAHLESEILLVDEVLAVGDAEFQKKCLGKMGDVADKEGRTVLFVSHNMAAVQQLCPQTALFQNGKLITINASDKVVPQYLRSSTQTEKVIEKYKVGDITIDDFCVTQNNQKTSMITPEWPFEVHIVYHVDRPAKDVLLGFDLLNEKGNTIFRSYDLDSHPLKETRQGNMESIFHMPANFLQQGNYFFNLILAIHRKTSLKPGRVSLDFSVNSKRETDVDFTGDIMSPGTWEVKPL